jgi:serine protease inhibitor
VPAHHFKNSKKIIQNNLRNAREHYNSDATIVRTEDRASEKIDEIIFRTEDRTSEKIDEIIFKVVISAVVGTEVAEVVAEGNRSYILVTQKSSITQLIRSL